VHLWNFLFDLLLLLSGAAAFGLLAERLGQSALIGYLLAGLVLGPGALNLIAEEGAVEALAELGVALLLFSIGLEFSWRRLKTLGHAPLAGGVLQIVLTTAIAATLALSLGVPLAAALAIGAILAPSSTACVLRILGDRAELEAVHGRLSLGVLLLQDAALVPLVAFVTLLTGAGGEAEVIREIVQTVVYSLLVVAALLLAGKFMTPLLLSSKEMAKNREIPILIAVATAIGSMWLSHAAGLSPALGAFVAGIFLAETPFAVQVRSEVAPLRTLFVTMFFTSIGMVADPLWIAQHIPLLILAVGAVLIGKTLITWLALLVMGRSHRHALATGVCLSQAGEFSFVLAGIAVAGGLFDRDLYQLIVSTAVITLLLTPPLVVHAPGVARMVEGLLMRTGLFRDPGVDAMGESEHPRDHVILMGYGPAGQMVQVALVEAKIPSVIVELNPKSVANAKRLGHRSEVGDATRREVLEHLGVEKARAVVITIPDHRASAAATAQVRALAPHVPVLVRARYHVHTLHLIAAGGEIVVDEESEVGRILGREVLELLGKKVES
jgi:CPA2 family monovalent cation:H+ antiporter-2